MCQNLQLRTVEKAQQTKLGTARTQTGFIPALLHYIGSSTDTLWAKGRQLSAWQFRERKKERKKENSERDTEMAETSRTGTTI